jgi:hypothetical protein
MPITLPTIHMNGTSRKSLQEGYDKADDSLHTFIDDWQQTECNARDYYVQGPDAYTKARDERMEINACIKKVKSYLNEMREHLYSK